MSLFVILDEEAAGIFVAEGLGEKTADEVVTSLDIAAAANMALVAARIAAKMARNAEIAASRAEGKRDRLQLTGGHYVCPGPLPGVSCANMYGTRHCSPGYEGSDWKCPHCRKRKYKFSAIIVSKESVPKKLNPNAAPWRPSKLRR